MLVIMAANVWTSLDRFVATARQVSQGLTVESILMNASHRLVMVVANALMVLIFSLVPAQRTDMALCVKVSTSQLF